MAIFIEDKELERIELQGCYMEAVAYTFSRWLTEKNNLQLLLRAGTEAWFADVFDCLSNDPIDYDRCDEILSETFQYGKTHFSNQADFLCVFGYMLKLSPFYFDVFDDDFEKWRHIGIEMIRSAHQLAPIDEFIQAMHSLDTNKRTYLSRSYFDGSSEVEVYFRNILCGD